MTSLEKIGRYDEKIWHEPGLWAVPRDPCYWITRDPKLGFSLSSQLDTVDDLECARTQWATRRSDNAFMNLAPDELVNQFLSDEERSENPVKPDPAFNHDRLEDVLAAIR
ncbi:reverse transcriptase [Phytophthora cinnamomi]|uniref:reverse transcriptase n=1 Tax=Phytophthora cinnamomi TaxID=4785 RepID=UPI00355A4161|nr:reverse transcriptase [Phytophthora cinnamomi]